MKLKEKIIKVFGEYENPIVWKGIGISNQGRCYAITINWANFVDEVRLYGVPIHTTKMIMYHTANSKGEPLAGQTVKRLRDTKQTRKLIAKSILKYGGPIEV